MLVKTLLILLSYLFNLLKLIISKLNLGNGNTLPGYILERIPLNILKTLFLNYRSKYIFITGTNGKTSSTALLSHILAHSNYVVLSNSSGSNLKRGIISTLLLNYFKYSRVSPDFIVLEIDEGSVKGVLSSLPDEYSFGFVVLNLSRDQLDRYGEIDILVNNIKTSLSRFNNYNLVLHPSLIEYNISDFSVYAKETDLYFSLIKKLSINLDSFTAQNLMCLCTLLNNIKIDITVSTVPDFVNVAGRGKHFEFSFVKYHLHLTKNPESFKANINILATKNIKDILIYMNDYIPDGRDVSWFYDIDTSLLKSFLYDKNVFLCGTRAQDFYNLLNINKINSFNLLTLESAINHFEKWNIKEVFILANYSATQYSVKKFTYEKIYN